MTTPQEAPMRSKEGWLDSISTALHVGCRARSVRSGRANRNKFLGEQIPYRSGYFGDDDR